MRTFDLSESTKLVLQQGDITKVRVDVIVNAANERMLGGGGVDGAIHRAAGPELREACAAVPEVRPGVRCPTGEARITPGFNLPARFVLHTVGPVYRGPESATLLRSAYRWCLEIAAERQLASIAFPAISCGVYGYPLADAASVALETCLAHGRSLREIHFVLFGEEPWAAWIAESERRFRRG
jgi:O-acetyl-ADP-ribose deacetylase (regulator of RNase III)